MSAEKISIAQQIDEAEFGFRARKSMYDQEVARGKMREAIRDLHVARMQAIIRTLRWIQANDPIIRDVVAAQKAGGQS